MNFAFAITYLLQVQMDFKSCVNLIILSVFIITMSCSVKLLLTLKDQ